MEDTLRSRMGKLTSLRKYIIRFIPRPWINTQAVEQINLSKTKSLKTVKTQKTPKTKKPKVKKVPKEKTVKQDKSFVDLHIEVTSKVDALIAQMESDGKFDNMSTTPDQKISLTHNKITTTLREIILRK